MRSYRDGILPQYLGYYHVIAVGLNSEGKQGLCIATGSCIDIGERLPSRAPFSPRDPFATQLEAEREKQRLLRKFNQGCHPDYWSPSVRLEIWTVADFADAMDSGAYANLLYT